MRFDWYLRVAQSLVARAGAITLLGLVSSYPAIAGSDQVTGPALAGALTVGLPAVVLFAATLLIRQDSPSPARA